MTSLLTLRPSPPELPAFLADAIPSAYEEAGRTQFQAMPGVQWIRDKGSPNGRGFYRGPREAIEIVAATLEAAKVCKARSELTRTPELPAHSMCDPRNCALAPPGFFDPRLREYQQEGAAWIRWQLQHSGAAFLADEMGLGKTPQAIAAARGATLVICPAIVVPHWQAEIAKWAAEPSEWCATSYEGFASARSGREPPKAKSKAVEFARLRQAIAACDTVIPDEIHYASNPKAQRSKALREWLAERATAGCRPAVIGLSGTPMSTRPRDLWHPLDLLWPGRFGSWWDFTKRYCAGRFEPITTADGARVTNADGEPLKPVWASDGISHAEELRARLQHCMLRRTKAQVGGELPPRTRIIHDVHLPATARRGLRAAAAAIDLHSARTGVGSLLANSEAYKIDAAEALAREVMAAGGRPLLLTTRRESAKELASRLLCPCVTGEDAADARAEMLRDAPAGCATLFSVETGINLTGFDCIIFVGLDWVPSRILQGESRIHRIGQDKPCTIYYLIARGTVDEVIKERVIARLDAFADITGAEGDERGLARELAPETEDDLLAAIVAAAKGQGQA